MIVRVDGLTEPPFKPLEFTGPATSTVFGHRYVMLTDGGIKDEGATFPGQPRADADDALKALAEQIREYTEGAGQIAWRRFPEASIREDGWRATCRLAVFGKAA